MTIEFHYENVFGLSNEKKYTDWIISMVHQENSSIESLAYIFCDDAYLAEINLQYLNHDTLTDIITFDYSDGSVISGDIFISTERVRENSEIFKTDFDNELKRVMAHGVLHLLGYNDKTEEEKGLMRKKEDIYIKSFHVEQ